MARQYHKAASGLAIRHESFQLQAGQGAGGEPGHRVPSICTTLPTLFRLPPSMQQPWMLTRTSCRLLLSRCLLLHSCATFSMLSRFCEADPVHETCDAGPVKSRSGLGLHQQA